MSAIERMRAVNDAKVEEIAKSMAAICASSWLRKDNGSVIFFCGLQKLGWDFIDAILVENATDIDVRRMEISENLHRSELTALERDQHIAEWINLTDEAERISAQVAPKLPEPQKRGRKAGGINKVSKELGIERTAAQRAIKVASLTDAAKAVAIEVGLDDNRTALLKAAEAGPEDDGGYAELQRAWGAANSDARAKFIEFKRLSTSCPKCGASS